MNKRNIWNLKNQYITYVKYGQVHSEEVDSNGSWTFITIVILKWSYIENEFSLWKKVSSQRNHHKLNT